VKAGLPEDDSGKPAFVFERRERMLIPAQSRGLKPLIAMLATILALSTILGMYAMSTLAYSKKITAHIVAAWTVHVASDHADVKHGGEAISTRNCLNRHGTWQVWREPDGSYHRLCRTPEGEIFDQIVRWADGNKRWEEVTAFRPDPGGKGNVWNFIRQWLDKKGAVPYKGPLPPPAR
jgi:putative hemolysin